MFDICCPLTHAEGMRSKIGVYEDR